MGEEGSLGREEGGCKEGERGGCVGRVQRGREEGV